MRPASKRAAWLDRVKSEVELWTELATKLSSTRSFRDALGTYQQCVTQRMQMAAEDGRRMSDEYQCNRAKSADDTSKAWSGRMYAVS